MKNLVLLILCLFIIDSVNAFQPPVRDSLIDDFEEMSLVSGMDGDGNAIGFLPFASPSGASSIGLTKTPPSQVPMADPMNQVLCNTFNNASTFAGFINIFANDAVNDWAPMDWSTYEGLRIWIYGNNTGDILFLDILDNRNPGSMTDDAERWSLDIPDDFSGWSFFEFTWDDFSRKEIANGAPTDGFNLNEINGYAFGKLGNVTTMAYYIDSVSIWGTRVIPLEVQFATNQYEVTEGETAQIEIVLDRVSTDPVMIMYSTAESTAVPDIDFSPVSGTMIISPGNDSGTFEVPTYDNDKPDGEKSVMINLFNPDGAELGPLLKTKLTILDDDPDDPMLIDDFEGCHPFQGEGNISARVVELAADDENAIPCQGPYENVVSSSGDGILRHVFTEAMDWSGASGLSFWFYGNGSGENISLGIKDNRSSTTANTPPNEWVLAWSDEFNEPNGTPPNPNVWEHAIGDGSLYDLPGWGNSELQFYTDSLVHSATDGNGNLVISVKKIDPQTTDLLCYYGPCEYTSARLTTKDKIAFEYGRIESRIKVPAGEAGLWPAFWALGTDIDEVGWPQTGEIDIMEYVSRLPDEIFGTIHGPGYSGGNSFGNLYDFGMPVADEYHTIALEWTPDQLIWSVDGIQFHQAQPSDIAPNEWVFNHPFFLLLNMAIGGNFGGAVSQNLTFPQEMLIDYVRVYQAPESAECFETSFVDYKKGWRQVFLPFSEFTRSNNQPAGAPDDGLGLDEVWGYSISRPGTEEVLFDQIRLSNGIVIPPCLPIPTMGEWGLILLVLVSLIFGILMITSKRLARMQSK